MSTIFKRGDQKKIAELAGISPQELYQALNKSTSLDTGEKIQKAALELGYDLKMNAERVIVKFDLNDGE